MPEIDPNPNGLAIGIKNRRSFAYLWTKRTLKMVKVEKSDQQKTKIMLRSSGTAWHLPGADN